MMERIAMNPFQFPWQGIVTRYAGILSNDSSVSAWALCDSAFPTVALCGGWSTYVCVCLRLITGFSKSYENTRQSYSHFQRQDHR